MAVLIFSLKFAHVLFRVVSSINVSWVLIASNQGSKLTLANSQNASDFDNLRVRKYPLAKVCELESSMSPEHLEKLIANGLTSLLVEKYFKANFAVKSYLRAMSKS